MSCRKWSIRFWAFALFAGMAGAQTSGGPSPLNCTVNVTATPQLRAEGYTETTGDITIFCTGGSSTAAPPGSLIPMVNITVFLNALVTSRLLPVDQVSNSISESLLLIDEPGSGIPGPVPGFGPAAPQSSCPTPLTGCTEYATNLNGVTVATNANNGSGQVSTATPGYNVFQGIVNGNSVTWFGVPVLAPVNAGVARVFRITNLRADATVLSGGSAAGATPMLASITTSNSATLTIANPTPAVGFVQSGLSTSASSSSMFQCGGETRAPASILSFRETFGTSFKTRVVPGTNTNYAGQGTNTSGLVSTQNVPGMVYNSESGFVYPVNATQTAGLTDFGTRLKATFNNVNTGVRLFVSVNNVTNAGLPVPVPAVPGGTATGIFAQLIATETQADGNTPADFPGVQATATAPGATGNVPVVEIPVVNGSATATWEILDTSPNTQETANFAVFATYVSNVAQNSPPPGTASVNLSFAPSPPAFSASLGAQASSTLSVPRFIADPNPPSNLLTIYTCGPALSFGKAADALTAGAGFPIGYTLAVSTGASGGMATGVTLNDPLPAGPGVNWSISPAYGGQGSCSITGSVGAQILGCAVGDLAPNVIATVHVSSSTSPASCGTYSNTAMAAATNSSSLQAGASTTVVCPSLSIFKAHIGSFVQGQTSAFYAVSVSNAPGAGPTSATVTVTENLPSGLTLFSMAGQGWTCPGGITCTRTDPLAGGSTYPQIIVTVNVAADASSPQINNVSVSGGGSAGATATDSTTILQALRFIPVTPCRIADTRKTNLGAFGAPSIAGGSSRDFNIPTGACGIPPTAHAYSLNVAVVPAGALGFLTLWPAGQTRPVASTLNSLDGRIKSNAAIVPAGTGGAVSLYASNATDVILDINGYFVPASNAAALAFYPITPCRLADTRKQPPAVPIGGPALVGQQSRTFAISGNCNLPPAAQAYSLNFAAVPIGPLGFLTAFPTGQTKPVAANLNAPTGTVTANAAIVTAGTNGSIDVFASNNTNLVIDVNGYFAPMATGGLSLYAVTPCRLLDTRKPAGSPAITSLDVGVSASACGIPVTAQAYVFSVAVVPPAALGFLTLWPQGQTRPVAATLNAVDAATTSNMAIVPTTNTAISAFASNATHLILDILGYFGQ